MKAFGDRLREAREAKSVSIRTIASSTRISERYLHALERSDLEALPGRVFDKGYINSYAEILGLDPKPLLESYGIEERKRQELTELADAPSAASAPRRFSLALLGAALVGLVAATAWVLFRDPPPVAAPHLLSEDPATVTRALSSEETSPAVREEEPDAVPERAAATPSPLTISEAAVGTGIVERNLVGRNDRFPEGAQVWLWTRIVGGKSGGRVFHVWIHEGRTRMNVELRVGGSHWRTYSTLELPADAAGEWVVEVRAAAGIVLARAKFLCVSRHDGT